MVALAGLTCRLDGRSQRACLNFNAFWSWLPNQIRLQTRLFLTNVAMPSRELDEQGHGECCAWRGLDRKYWRVADHDRQNDHRGPPVHPPLLRVAGGRRRVPETRAARGRDPAVADGHPLSGALTIDWPAKKPTKFGRMVGWRRAARVGASTLLRLRRVFVPSLRFVQSVCQPQAPRTTAYAELP